MELSNYVGEEDIDNLVQHKYQSFESIQNETIQNLLYHALHHVILCLYVSLTIFKNFRVSLHMID